MSPEVQPTQVRQRLLMAHEATKNQFEPPTSPREVRHLSLPSRLPKKRSLEILREPQQRPVLTFRLPGLRYTIKRTWPSGMPARSKGGRRRPWVIVPRSGECFEGSAPIGSLAVRQLATKTREGLQSREERQPRDEGPAIAKKRSTDLESNVSIEGDALLQITENAVANACRGFAVPDATGGSVEAMQSLRSEMSENLFRVQVQVTEHLNAAMTRMQAEADTPADAMLEAGTTGPRRI